MHKYFDEIGFQLTPQMVSQFESFYQLLIEENEKYNLTAITDKKDVYIKHFVDSILINQLDFDLNDKKIIDIGTGAGFPALPIKITNPSVRVTCLDSLNKRIGFLNMVTDALELKHVEKVHGRAEDFGQNKAYREQYDFAVSRAVAELRLLLEFVMPFVKVGGYFIAYKSLKSDQELKDADNAMKVLKCELVDIIKFDLPEDSGTRDLMIFKKTGQIAKNYPRKAGLPKKNPL